MSVQFIRHRFTVAQYDQMAAAGVFQEDERLELIAGEIIEMSPISMVHAACVKRLNRIFTRKLGDDAIIGIQDPIHLDEHSEPEPDVVLLHPRPDFYVAGHPEPEDIFLLIEVSETSLAYDREVKLPLYARAGIMEVWLVNVREEVVELYRQPTPDGFAETRQYRKGNSISPLAFPDLNIVVEQITG
ncbi:MAG TPA: Uma2 family endonuclease [Chloroflexi bacterium]|nr:Uma2 family endonuclease [Chloroflexota bacterium]